MEEAAFFLPEKREPFDRLPALARFLQNWGKTWEQAGKRAGWSEPSRRPPAAPIAALTEISYDETGNHLLRTQRYVWELAAKLAERGAFPDVLTPENLPLIARSALLHDIGKAGIPGSILLKPGPLTREEFEIVKTHTTLGRDALVREEKRRNVSPGMFLRFAEEIVYSHHEHWNGTGYPAGLKGEEIPVSARLMALADVYDALTSKRVYKEAYSHEQAVLLIREGAGTHFDPKAVEAFLALEAAFEDIAACYSVSG